MKLSVALICRNEQAVLPQWLEAVRPFADEIVAVDSGSSDATQDILRAAGARVEHRDWSGYADQRIYAESLCTGDWILFLDADEIPDAGFAYALNQLKQGPPPPEQALEIARKHVFCGRFLRHGGFFPEYILRLYRPGAARWVQREVHESLQASGPVGRVAGAVEHRSYNSVGDYLRRMERYSAEAAREMHKNGRRASAWDAVAHAGWCFFSRYFLRLGFLDGFEGYLAARLESLYTLAKYSRLREMQKAGNHNP
jgi:glycosyltransferase involved in cell wall biosynthesis